MEATMRDCSPRFSRWAVSWAPLACALAFALGAAALAGADDLFGPEPAKAGSKPALMCPAAARTPTDVQSRIDAIQRMMAASRGTQADGGPFTLNGAGYNYGPPSHEVDPGALSFEAKRAR